MTMNEYIEQLAAQKPFDALTEEERAVVLSTVSRETYEQIRVILEAAPALDGGLEPPIALRETLIRHMKTNAPAARPLWLRPVPAWQAAAAMMLVAAALVFWLKKDGVRAAQAPVVLVQRDTVVLTQTEWKERIIVREKVVFKEKKTAGPLASTDNTSPQTLPEADFSNYEFPTGPVGTSLGNEPELLDFFVKIQQ